MCWSVMVWEWVSLLTETRLMWGSKAGTQQGGYWQTCDL